jgi:hypothetical protein
VPAMPPYEPLVFGLEQVFLMPVKLFHAKIGLISSVKSRNYENCYFIP